MRKNKSKQIDKPRKTWVGYYTRKTPTKQEKLNKELKKQKSTLLKCGDDFH